MSSLTATPVILNPPNNRFVTVMVSGFVIDSSARLTPHAQYQVTDEYRLIEPGGRVTLTKVLPTVYKFKFPIVLQAKRGQSDLSGRQYYVAVGAQDIQGAEGLTIGLLVPHDKRLPASVPASSTVQLPSYTARPPRIYLPPKTGLFG